MNSIFKICTFKAKLRRAVSLLLIVALMTGLLPQSVYASSVPKTDTSDIRTYEGDGYEVVAEITAMWGSYANVDVKIINKSLHRMKDWQMELPKTFTWNNLWNAQSAGENGNSYVLEGADYNKDIGLFGQVSFGGTMFFSSGEVSLWDACTLTDAKMREKSDTAGDDTKSEGEDGSAEEKEEDEKPETGSSRLPYEIPEELSGLNYALFCADTQGVAVYSNETKVEGDIHSEGDFTYAGTKLSVTGTLEAAGDIRIQTSSMENARRIGSEKENAARIQMPDLCTVLKENVFTDQEEIKENIEISKERFFGDGILYAEQDILYNVDEASSAEDKSLILCAENGNITLNGSKFAINGVLYAPNGCVTINAHEATINGRILAKKVCLNGTYFNLCAGDHDFDKIREWIEEGVQEEEILTAEISVGGNLKQNRRISLDLNSTGEETFDETLQAEWSFAKKSGDTWQEMETVCIDTDNSTDIHKELLLKEAGTYKVSVLARRGEQKLNIEKELVIAEDLAPEAGFAFTQDFFVRDESGTATIEARDTSVSHDGDEIAKRNWQIIYDADGNGVFDERPEYMEEAQTEGLSFATKKIGSYKVMLSVREHFDDTIERFITQEDYLSDDTSDVTESSGIIRVLNEAPTVSFEMEKPAKADIVFTTSDTEKGNIDYVNAQMKKLKEDLIRDGIDAEVVSVNSALLTAKDKFAWKEYDHYNVKEAYGHKQVVERHITHDDASIHITGYTVLPYVDFLFVPDENRNTKMLQFDIERDKSNWHTIEGGGFLFNTEVDEENDIINGFCVLLCQTGIKVMHLDHISLSGFRDANGKSGTCIASVKMTNVLEKKQLRVQADEKKLTIWCNGEPILSNFILPESTSFGYGPILWNSSHACDQISHFEFRNIKMTTVEGDSLGDVLAAHPWREGAQRYVLQLSDVELPELKDDATLAETAKTLMEKDIFLFAIGEEGAKQQVNRLLLQTDKGMFLSRGEMEKSMQTLTAYISNVMKQTSYRIGDYISPEDLLSYKTVYTDKENDAMNQSEWTYAAVSLGSQDETLSDIETAVYETPLETISKTGAYTISLRVQDNPGSISQNTVSGNEIADSNPFGQWSEPYVYPQTIVVQSRPVADLSVSVVKDISNSKKCAFTVTKHAFDPDHRMEEGNGIIAEDLSYKEIGDDKWTQGAPQYSLPLGGRISVPVSGAG